MESLNPEASEDAITFIVLSLADETFAIVVDKVKEIVRVPAITWIPGSREPVKGVINLRGSVVPVVDLAGALSLDSVEEGPDARIVIVDADAGLVGMLVSSVIEVTDIPVSALEPAMSTLADNQKQLVKAQTNHNEVLVGVLDIERIIESIRSSTKKAI